MARDIRRQVACHACHACNGLQMAVVGGKGGVVDTADDIRTGTLRQKGEDILPTGIAVTADNIEHAGL